MVRLIVLALVAFLIAMSSVTGVMVLHHRSTVAATGVSADSAAVADSLHAGEALAPLAADAEPVDSVGAMVADGDTTTAGAASQDAEAIASADSAAAAPGATTQTGPDANGVREAATQAAAVVDSSSALLPERRLGKIFGSMQPKEAARVLEQMDDRDVVVILAMLSDRHAAAVMASLPPQRAAAISRLGFQAGRHTP
jgi:hypothetical protein